MTTPEQPIKDEEIDLTIHYLGDKKVIRFLRTCMLELIKIMGYY